MNTKIQEKLKLLPDKPGVYKMFNAQGELIYVGKAVNLKNRVRQYFQSQKNHTAKVRAMVSNICDFDFVIVTNETEALNLESNLIKQNMPYYNILLKDDKHFPYIRIDFRQDFPRVEIVRRYKRDGAKYFGPYLSSFMLRESIEAVRENFPVRPVQTRYRQNDRPRRTSLPDVSCRQMLRTVHGKGHAGTVS